MKECTDCEYCFWNVSSSNGGWNSYLPYPKRSENIINREITKFYIVAIPQKNLSSDFFFELTKFSKKIAENYFGEKFKKIWKISKISKSKNWHFWFFGLLRFAKIFRFFWIFSDFFIIDYTPKTRSLFIFVQYLKTMPQCCRGIIKVISCFLVTTWWHTCITQLHTKCFLAFEMSLKFRLSKYCKVLYFKELH